MSLIVSQCLLMSHNVSQCLSMFLIVSHCLSISLNISQCLSILYIVQTVRDNEIQRDTFEKLIITLSYSITNSFTNRMVTYIHCLSLTLIVSHHLSSSLIIFHCLSLSLIVSHHLSLSLIISHCLSSHL